MSAHDLMVLIAKPFNKSGYCSAVEAFKIGEAAEAILAAGYRKPRTVDTDDDLESLPLLAVIRDADGNVHERLEWNYGPALQWVSDGAEGRHPKLPATVLYQPEETEA